MAAAAHNPAFAKKVGIPQKVAKDFNKADTGSPLLKAGARAEALRRHKPKHKEPDAEEQREGEAE